jgi:hypothetical protein
MSSDVKLVSVGTVANDGSGDAIRSAFQTVNSNFSNIDTRISTGNYGVVYSGTYIQANLTLSSLGPTYTNSLEVYTTANVAGNVRLANLTVNNAFVATTVTSIGNTYVQDSLNVTNSAHITKNLVVVGNLTVLGNTATISSSDLAIQDSMINLHTPADLSTLTIDDGKDIGIQFHYYKTSDKHAALVWANDSQAFEFYADGIEGVGNVFSGTYGNLKIGSLFASNTTATTSATTGAIQTRGGIGAAGTIWAGGNLNVTGNTFTQSANVKQLSVSERIVGSLYLTGLDTVYINGSPVATSSASFSGGTVPNYSLFAAVIEARGNIFANSNVASISTTTGALTVNGGAGISGNIYAGGIQNTPIGLYTASTGTFTVLKTTGNIVAGSGTDSSSVTTGALVVSGGIGLSGNLTVGGSINNTSIGVYGAGTGNFTTLNASYQTKLAGNAVAYSGTASGNVSTGAMVVVGGLGVSGNVNAGSLFSDNYKFANGAAFVSTTLANTAEITANLSSGNNVGLSLVASGVTANPYGNVTYYTTFTTDSKGRLTAAGNTRSYINLSGTSGTGTLDNQGTLTFASSNGVTSNISSSTVTISTSQDLRTSATPTFAGITTSAAIVPNANATVNLGSTSAWFNNIYGVSSQAKYADLAEKYTSDAEYAPGTVLVFGGTEEVTVATEFADTRVAGAVTTDPAYLMNAELNGVSVALRGRIPINVIGKVTKGDLLVSSTTPGYAISVGTDKIHGPAIFAKSLNDKDDDGTGQIEAVIL